jgi:hypothetical protein
MCVGAATHHQARHWQHQKWHFVCFRLLYLRLEEFSLSRGNSLQIILIHNHCVHSTWTIFAMCTQRGWAHFFRIKKNVNWNNNILSQFYFHLGFYYYFQIHTVICIWKKNYYTTEHCSHVFSSAESFIIFFRENLKKVYITPGHWWYHWPYVYVCMDM